MTEEVWSWWQQGSVHRAPGRPPRSWPTRSDAQGVERAVEDEALAVAADVLKEVRKAKSEARRPMRAPVSRVLVRDLPARLSALELGAEDLCAAGSIAAIETADADEFAVEVELAEEASEG